MAELRRQIDRLGAELEDERRERRQLADRLWELQQKFTRLLTAPDQQPSTGTAWPPSGAMFEAVRRSVRRFVDNNSA